MQEKLPPFAFYPQSDGEVILGHQVSPETAQLTRVPLRLERQAPFSHRLLRRHRLRQVGGRRTHGL